MEPLLALSRFYYICAILMAPLAWVLVVLFKRYWSRGYGGEVEASPEEVLEELDREFPTFRRTSLRTQTEYLPFLFECIRENIDSGFEDSQMISLLERIERQRPDEDHSARFTVTSGSQQIDLQIRWNRDACGRISLHIQGSPAIIRALKEHKRKIPGAIARVVS